VEGANTAYFLLGPVELDGLTAIAPHAEIIVDTSSLGQVADRLGDIDGDGVTELVFQRVENGALKVRLLLSKDEAGAPLPRELGLAWFDGQARGRTISLAGGTSVYVLEFDGRPGDDLLVFGQLGPGVVGRVISAPDVRLGASTAAVTFRSGQPASALELATPGDVNGDGLDDVVVFNPLAGVATLALGRFAAPGSNLDLDLAARIDLGPSVGIDSLSVVGDLNHDGYDEIALSGKNEDATSGALFVFFGGEDPAAIGEDADLVFARDGAAALQPGNVFTGPLQATAGDLNADGRMDLVIGEPQRELKVGGQVLDRNDEGRVHVFFSVADDRGQTLVLSQADARLKGEFEFDAFGSLSGRPATDLNGDGIDDLLIGAAGASGVIDGIVPQAGRVYVVPGAPELFDLPDVFDFLANLTVTGSGDFLVDEGTGRPYEQAGSFAPGESERWFRFTTLGDGRSGNAIVLGPGLEGVQTVAPTAFGSANDASILEFDLGAFLDQAADPALLERVLLQLVVQRAPVEAAAAPSNLDGLVASGGRLFFVADDGAVRTLWVSDGTPDGTRSFASDGIENPANLTDVGGTLFFTANPDASTVELFRTDGTTAERVVVDLIPRTSSHLDVEKLPISASQFTTDGIRLYFVADDTALVSSVAGSLASDRHGEEIWVSDGTTAGTHVLDSIAVPARVGVEPERLTPAGDSSVFGDSVFFTARALNPNGSLGTGRILWQTDDAGMSRPILVGTGSGAIAEPGQIVAFGGTMFFVSDQGNLFWLTREFPPATLVSGDAPADGQVSGAGSNLLTFNLAGGQSATIAYRADETQGSTTASQLVDLLRTKIAAAGLAGAVQAGLDAGTDALTFSTVAGGSGASLQLRFDAVGDPAVVTAAGGRDGAGGPPANGQVTGTAANVLSFFIGGVEVGAVSYAASDTQLLGSPGELAGFLNERIQDAGFADRVVAGYDALSNRLTFSTVAPADGSSTVALRAHFEATEPATVVAQDPAPADGRVVGESNLAIFFLDNVRVGEIAYRASETQTFTSPFGLVDYLNGKIDAAGLADLVVAGYDAGLNRMTFATVAPGSGVTLRLGFDASDTLGFASDQSAVTADGVPDTLGFVQDQSATGIDAVPDRLGFAQDQSASGADLVAVLPQTSAFTGVSQVIVVPGADAADDILFVAYSPDGQAFKLDRVDQTGTVDAFGNPTFMSTEVASLPAAPTQLTASGGRLFFVLPERIVTVQDSDGTLRDELTGPELWTSDGTGAGTTTIAGFEVGTMPGGFTDVGGRLFLTGDLGEGDGAQLFEVVDDAGTLFLAPIVGTFTSPTNLAAVGDRLYFTAGDAPWFSSGAGGEPSQFLAVEEPEATVRVSVLEREGDLAVSADDATAAATAVEPSPALPGQSGVLSVDITERVRSALASGQTRLTLRLDEVVGADDASFDLESSTLDVTTRADGVLADLYSQEGALLDSGKSVIDMRALEAGTYFLRVFDPMPGGGDEDFVIAVKAPLQGDVHPQTDRDTIRGGDGDDLLVGNFGVDRLFGDSGADAYRAEAIEIRDLDDGEGSSVQPPADAEVHNQKPRPVDVLVDVPDAELRAAIGEALGKPVTMGFDGQPVMKAPIFASDLAELTRLDLGSRGIADLAGLEYAINLRALNLTGNPALADISEMRPGRVLSGEAVGNLIGFSRLEALALDATAVADLLPLETLANLRLLSMDHFVLTTSDEGPLQAQYFELDDAAGPAQFPDWRTLEPIATRTDLQAAAGSFGEGLAGFVELQGILGARWSGQLLVEAAGEFTFTLAGGTAARLFIDDLSTPLGPMAVLTASRDGPSDGRLAQDLRFSLKQGEATALVELAAADTEEYSDLDELIDALNQDLQGSGFVAGRDGERLTFTRTGSAQPIDVILGEGDSGPAELGFSGKEASVLLSTSSVTITLGEGLHDLRYEVVGLDAGNIGEVLSWTAPAGSARLVFPDLDEALARIDSLRFLSLAHSALVNVNALATLDNLEQLYLEGNDIRDISALTGAALVDDGDAGFAVIGGAFQQNIFPVDGAFEQDYLFAPSLAQGEGVQWTFEDLNDGRYELFVTWLPHEARATQVRYEVVDVNGNPLEVRDADGEPVQTLRVNQRLAPAGADHGGRPWQSLGLVDVVGGEVRVTLAGPAAGFVAADAMRLAAVAPVLPNLRALNLEGNPLDHRAQDIYLPRVEDSVAELSFDANAAPDIDTVLPQVVLPSGALSFDGVDDVVTVADHPALEISERLTVEITFSVDPAVLAALDADWMPLIAKGDGFASPYTVALNKAGFVRFSSLDTSGAVTHVDTPILADFAAGDAQTFHFTGVMDRDAHRLQAYVDGELVGERPLFFRAAQPAITTTVKVPIYFTLPLTNIRIVVGYETRTIVVRPALPELSFDAVVNSAPLRIGDTDAPGFAPLKARVDEVRVWNRVLGGEEIASLANRNLTGSEAGLIGLFEFEGRSLDTVADTTGRLQGVLGDGSNPDTKPTRDGLLGLSVSDPEGDPVVLNAISSNPAGVVVNVVGSALSIAPDPGFAGTALITVTAADGIAANPLGGVREVRFDFTAGANAIYGTKFRDLNANGVRDDGEPGLESVRFFLDANGNGVLDLGETSTYTDANGHYAFRGLVDPARTYTLVEIPPPGLRPTDGLRSRIVAFDGLGEIATGVDFAGSEDDIAPVDFGNVDNIAPVAVEDSYVFDEDTLLEVEVLQGLLANDSDANLDVLTTELVSGPQHGVLGLNPNGSFSYDPDADFNGQDQFTYRAFDGELRSDPITVLLTVNPVNDAPAHEFGPSQSVDEDTKLVFSARRDNALTIRDADAGADPVTVTLTALNGTLRFDTLPGIDHGTHTITDTVAAINNFLEGFVFVPALNFNGEALIVVTTDDLGHNGAGSAFITTDTITITVNPVDDPTVAVGDAFAILEDGALSAAAPGVLANDLEVDGDPLVAHLVTDVSHGVLAFNPDGSFSYTPAADFNGTDEFTYLVNVGVGESNVATVTLEVASVNDVPAFTKGPDVARGEDTGPQAIAGWATGIAAGAANEAAQALEFLVATSNPGLFSALPSIAADGTLTFTSAPDAHGVAAVVVALRDDGGTENGGLDTSAPQVFTITILPVNDAPTFAKGPDLVVDEDEGPQVFEDWATGISVGPADEAGQAYFFEVTNDQAALFDEQPTLDASGTLRFAPKADAFGTATVSVVLRDSGGTANGGSDASAVQTFKITVAPLNDRPVAIGAIGATFDVEEDEVLSDALTGFDVDGDALTFSAFGPGPVHGALALAPDGSFTYTPDDDFFGTDVFGFRVSDGITSSLAAVVTIHVAPVNDAPVAAPESYDLVEDEPLDLSVFGPAFGVLANDVDVDGDALTAILASQAAHGTVVLDANGTFLYTPNADFFGGDTFTYQARDPSGVLSNVATVSLFVENQNDAPVAFDVTLETDEDAALEALLPVADADGDALAFEILDQPLHGALELLDGGAFRYTPDADFFGSDSFTVRASDGLLPSAIGTVSIQVAPVNDAPVLEPLGDREVDEGKTLSFTAAATDVDVPAEPHTFSLVAGAPAGAAIAAGGLFSWTPAESQGPGSFAITIRVTDDGDPALYDEDTFTVTVNETNLAPVLDAIGDRVVDELTELSFTATATDADLPANGLTFSLMGAPDGASIDADTGLFTWTPGEAQGPGSYRFEVVVTDDGAGALSDAGTLAVTMNEVNLAPVLDPIGGRTVSEGELLSFTIGATDADLPANALTFSADGLPSGASFDPSTRTFSWMPVETQGCPSRRRVPGPTRSPSASATAAGSPTKSPWISR